MEKLQSGPAAWSDLSRAAQLVLLFVLPALLPFAQRAGPLLLCVAFLLQVGRLMRERALRCSLWRIPVLPALLGIAFLIWAGLSLRWTPWPSRGALAVANASWVFAAGIVFVLPGGQPIGSHRRILAWGILIGAATIVLGILSDGALLRILHERSETYRYNVVLVTFTVLCWPLLSGCWKDSPVLRLASLALMSVAISLSESETAKVAVCAGLLAYLVAMVLPRWLTTAFLILGTAAAWLGFLWFAPVATQLASDLPSLAVGGHAAERLQIWRAFSEMALAGLPWGWGVESVALASKTQFFATASESVRAGLNWMHPHNNVLQIAVETGIPGLALGLLGSLVLIARMHLSRASYYPAAAAAYTAIVLIALISHGFWQTWWWATVVVAIWMMRLGREEASGRAKICPPFNRVDHADDTAE